VLDLVPLATLRITISQHTRVDRIPIGARLVGEASACDIEGRVVGHRAGACTDWLTRHADGTVSVDARLLLETSSGAHLTIRYTGKGAALPATGAPVYVVPTFETDDPEYAWLNTIQAVGKGVRADTSLIYELYELR
jgi:Protein of unknown function (DUF3237)